MHTIKIKIIDYARKREVKGEIDQLNTIIAPYGVFLEADITHEKPQTPTMVYKGKNSKGKGRYNVSDGWLRDHITPDHQQYDLVCFSFEDKDWYAIVGKDQNSVGGTEFGRIEGVPVIAMTATRGQTNDLSGQTVSEWLRRFLHELSHMVAGVLTKQKDLTHYYDYTKGDLLAFVAKWKLETPSETPQKPDSEEEEGYTDEELNKLDTALTALKRVLLGFKSFFSSKKKEPPKYIAVHHTLVERTNAPQLEAINNYHKEKWNDMSSLGWYVGYNEFVDVNGKRTKTRKWGEETIANKGHNCDVDKRCDTYSVCFALNGNIQRLNEAQAEAFRAIREEHSTSEVSLHRLLQKNRTCPGNLITVDYLTEI